MEVSKDKTINRLRPNISDSFNHSLDLSVKESKSVLLGGSAQTMTRTSDCSAGGVVIRVGQSSEAVPNPSATAWVASKRQQLNNRSETEENRHSNRQKKSTEELKAGSVMNTSFLALHCLIVSV